MISGLLTATLETIFNRYLRLDPETISKLADLKGSVILIQFPDYKIQFYLLPNQTGVQLLNKYAGTVDTTIKSSPFTLLRQMKNKHFEKISITGDIELGQQVRDLLQQMNIDWEEQLSKFTGDVIAHQIGQGVRGVLGWGKKTADNMQQNVTEYLQEEALILPSKKEMNDFLMDVSTLRNDTERLEATFAMTMPKENSK